MRKLGILSNAGYSLAEIVVVLGLMSIVATVGYQRYKDMRIKAIDKGTINHLNSLELAIVAYQANFGDFPPNPNPGAACSSSSNPAVHHAGCLDMPTLIFDFRHLKMYNEHPLLHGEVPFRVRYYNYNPNLAVIQVTLHSENMGNECQFTTGTWCNTATRPTTYCKCIGGGATPP